MAEIRPALRLELSEPHLKAHLKARLEEARRFTLGYLERMDRIDPALFHTAVHPDFSPVGWHLGHIATFAGYWILQQLAGEPPLAPDFDRIFMPDRNPKQLRSLLPGREEVVAYLENTDRRIQSVLQASYLETANQFARGGLLFFNVLQHEYQHCETLALVLHQYRPGLSVGGRRPTALPRGWGGAPEQSEPTRQIEVPGGTFEQGTDAYWVYDNERPAHPVTLPAFRIDVHPVTNAQFLTFVQAGGYGRRELWSIEGWEWRTARRVNAPGAWAPHPEGGWYGWGLGSAQEIVADAPVTEVSWYEADAYARWRGLELPTEAEWERAASWDPDGQRTYPWGEAAPDSAHAACDLEGGGPARVGSREAGRSALGCMELAGNVWEWTSSWFQPYDGFQPFPYEGYSVPWFGDHRVLRGGAWTTRAGLLRTTFRNWYVPTCREIFSGFRCVDRSLPVRA